MDLNQLFGQIVNTVSNHASERTPGPAYDANPLLGALQGLFGQYANQNGQQYQPHPDYDQGQTFANTYGGSGVAPASQDRWGDPADAEAQGGSGQGSGVAPASQDPWGDPANQQR